MNGNASAAIHTWSTDAVPPSQRLDYWIGAVCEGFLEMDVTSSFAGSFGATLESAPLGAIGVNRVRGTAQDVYRTNRAIAHSRSNYYYYLPRRTAARHACSRATRCWSTRGGRRAGHIGAQPVSQPERRSDHLRRRPERLSHAGCAAHARRRAFRPAEHRGNRFPRRLADASHFVRQCRRHLGATPGALRRQR
ncbi:hypothetical protein [Variovorax paradoxus]|uniref:hypothetical protein n=1 Tax=Variovorax paradoxus TaxID=34073 RepID=UPI0027D8863C|nr:hypothetical protein [Variovorax paradoxus]